MQAYKKRGFWIGLGVFLFFAALSELLRTFGSLYMSFQSALLHIEVRKGSFGISTQALRACIAPAWIPNRRTGAAELSRVSM